jgi:hypothetical protein
MPTHLLLVIVLGFVVFLIGGLARTHMNRVIRDSNPGAYLYGKSTEVGYLRLVKGRKAPILPFLVTIVCIPLGVALVFGAIAWHNHLKGPPSIKLGPRPK